MTQPVDQAQLKAEMETLAKVFVSVSAVIADCTVAGYDKLEPWVYVKDGCVKAIAHIHNAIYELSEAHASIKRST